MHTPGSEWLDRIDRMLVEWNMLAARSGDDSMTRIYMAVSCAFGKLLVHFSDFENTDVRDFRPLKICLGKHTAQFIFVCVA